MKKIIEAIYEPKFLEYMYGFRANRGCHDALKAIIRMIKRFLKAGIIENTKKIETTEGTPQGSILSSVLANIYMHYVLALWFEKKIKQN